MAPGARLLGLYVLDMVVLRRARPHPPLPSHFPSRQGYGGAEPSWGCGSWAEDGGNWHHHSQPYGECLLTSRPAILLSWRGMVSLASLRIAMEAIEGNPPLLSSNSASEVRVSPSDEKRIDILHLRPGPEIDLVPDIAFHSPTWMYFAWRVEPSRRLPQHSSPPVLPVWLFGICVSNQSGRAAFNL